MKALFKRTMSGFVPVDDEGREMHAKWQTGDQIMMEARRPRHPRHHRFIMALAALVVENSNRYLSVDHFIRAAKYYAGHYDEYPQRDGKVICVLRSISFASMSQDEFQPFADKALDLACKVLAVDAPAMLAEVEERIAA
jgi:hypothetical protein